VFFSGFFGVCCFSPYSFFAFQALTVCAATPSKAAISFIVYIWVGREELCWRNAFFVYLCAVVRWSPKWGARENIKQRKRGTAESCGLFLWFDYQLHHFLVCQERGPSQEAKQPTTRTKQKKKKKELLLLVYLPDLVIQETGSPRPTTGIGAATQTVQQRNTL
jgi:hypothetical protein